MARLAADAIFSFSLTPLRIGLSLGVVFFILAVMEVMYVLSLWLNNTQNALAPGWSSLMFMMLIIGSIQMIITGFIGIYVGYIFQEVKRRPPYLIRTFRPGGLDEAGES
jgi:dolichol-phosphate mannosyltransferase